MSGIPSHLSGPLREALADCEQFETNRSLRAVFAHEWLSPWRNSLPQADSLMGRVDAVINFLHEKRRRDGSNALVLLLRVLRGKINEHDERHQRLSDLADALETAFGGGAPIRPTPSPGAAQPDWDTSTIRALLTAAFDDQEITALCFDHFGPVQDDFSVGMSKGQKIQRLLDYCVRHGQVEKLMALVRQYNPTQYARFEGRLR
jgi:hypothetical protein